MEKNETKTMKAGGLNLFEFLNKIANDFKCNYSDESIHAVENILDVFEFDNDTSIEDITWTECNEYFVYDSDAYNYLMDQVGGDLSEAIYEGCDQITTIAGYYLNQEVTQIINEIEEMKYED